MAHREIWVAVVVVALAELVVMDTHRHMPAMVVMVYNLALMAPQPGMPVVEEVAAVWIQEEDLLEQEV
jgi:hypothetical protein